MSYSLHRYHGAKNCRRDVSANSVNTAKFLAFLFERLNRTEKAIANGGKKVDHCVNELASAVCDSDMGKARLLYRAALLSSAFFVALHLEYRISSSGDDDELYRSMQEWRRRLLKNGASGDGFALEVYNFIEEKGARLAAEQDGGLSSFTDHLESVAQIDNLRGLASPFEVPAHIVQVCLLTNILTTCCSAAVRSS